MDQAHAIALLRQVDNDLVVKGDPNAWKMILVNLLSNAIKYHDLGKAHPFIRLSMSSSNRHIHLTVEDNGQGIPKTSQKRVFEMFYRAHETASGSGLGLFLVKRMVDRLGGTIQIQSDPGKGTSVTVIVPSVNPTKVSPAEPQPVDAPVTV